MIGQLHPGRESGKTRRQLLGRIAGRAFKDQAGHDFCLIAGADRANGLGDLPSALRRKTGADLPISAHMFKCPAQAAQQQPAVQTECQHAKPLFQALVQILVTRRHHSAIFPGRADRVLGLRDHLGHTRPLPLPRIARRRRIIRRAEKENLHTVDV